MIDLDFDFDFGNESEGLRHRIKFDLASSVNMIIGNCLPKDGETIRHISPAGGFSSCSVILAISEETEIKSIKMTTLRAGKKELLALENIGVEDVEIVCGGIALENAQKYDYAKFLKNVADRNGWRVAYKRNHSKVILLVTEAGKITIETSSNFNENPQIEQFCITNDNETYDWYLDNLRKCGIFAD